MSLGVLYYKVPGWPLGFGSTAKARASFQRALLQDPKGLDNNYFYGDFLAQEGNKASARQYLQRALQAPTNPDRPVWDWDGGPKSGRSSPSSDEQPSVRRPCSPAVGRQLANPSGSGWISARRDDAGFQSPPDACADRSARYSSRPPRPRHWVRGRIGLVCSPADHLAVRCRSVGDDAFDRMAPIETRPEVGPGVRLRHGDMLALPFGANAFDRILASNVLYFFAPTFRPSCKSAAGSPGRRQSWAST